MLKLWEDAKVLVCIFRNNLLNISISTYDFFLLYAYLYDLKPLAPSMLLVPGINTARE